MNGHMISRMLVHVAMVLAAGGLFAGGISASLAMLETTSIRTVKIWAAIAIMLVLTAMGVVLIAFPFDFN